MASDASGAAGPSDGVPRRSARPEPAAGPAGEDGTFLWRALPEGRGTRARAPLVYLPGLGPHSTGRTRLQRLLLRLEVIGLSRHHTVWLVGRRSALAAGTTIASLAEGNARAIRARFDRAVDVVGESTGGSIALQLALDHPDVVDRLVLVSAAASLECAGRAAQRDVVRSLRDGRSRRAAGILLAATTRRPIRRRLLRVAGFALGRVIVGRSDDDLVLMEAEDRFDLRHDLDRVTAPTVVVGGARDGFYSPTIFRLTADLMPDAAYVEFPRKGHMTASMDRAAHRVIRRHLPARSERGEARSVASAPPVRRPGPASTAPTP